MPIVIEIVMMSVAAIMLLLTKVNVDEVPKTATLRAGVVAVIGIFGLAWLGDSFIAAHKDVIVPAIGDWAKAAPWTFAFGLFFASVLLYSQAATTRALMPLGIALGIPPQFLIAMFPSVNGYFFIPTYGSLIAAINFDLSGTTKIGKYVLNHSFMIPGWSRPRWRCSPAWCWRSDVLTRPPRRPTRDAGLLAAAVAAVSCGPGRQQATGAVGNSW